MVERTATNLEGMIYELDDSTINKIAAGEVVESPSSVLKELIENAVDAGATHIRVDGRGGGFEQLCVHDDGAGMRPDQLPLALVRHATSKIRKIDDMRYLETMGFRGEALASISSVSRFCLRSCRVGEKEGAQLEAEGGVAGDVEPCARSCGTSVEVRDLFYNVPARRKFQKTHRGSAMQLQKCLLSMATAYPEIAFTYTYNGQKVLDVPSAASDPSETLGPLLARLKSLYSSSLLKEASSFCLDAKTIPSAREAGLKRVYGFLCDPQLSSTQRRGQHMVVNRRYVFSPLLAKAVESGYGHFLPQGRKAQFFLFIEMDPDCLDVNVHPQKSQVRFAKDSAIYRALYAAVAKVLHARHLSPAEDESLRHREPAQFEPGSISAQVSHSQQIESALEERSDFFAKSCSFQDTASDPALSQALMEPAANKEERAYSRSEEILGGKCETDVEKAGEVSGDLLEEVGRGDPLSESILFTAEQKPLESVQEGLFSSGLVPPLFSWKQWAVWDLEKLPPSYQEVFARCVRVQSRAKSRSASRDEEQSGLLFVYLRRAQARIFYEKKMQALFGEMGSEKELPSQRLLIPYTISVSASDLRDLLCLSSALEKIGVVIGALGEEQLAVHTAPVGASAEMMETFFEHLLQSLRFHFSHNDVQDYFGAREQEGVVGEAVSSSLLKIALMELAKSVEMRQYNTSERDLSGLLSDLSESYRNRMRSDQEAVSARQEEAAMPAQDATLAWGMSPLGKEIAVIWGYKEIMDQFARRLMHKAPGG